MQSTNAKKGGNADYKVGVAESSIFFPAGDNSDDTWQDAQILDSVELGTSFDGWIGFGDKSDFVRFELNESAMVSLDFDDGTDYALEKKQAKVSCFDGNGKAVKLTSFDGNTIESKGVLAAGTYYLGITCADPKKNDVTYKIVINTLA